jgi:hypothetical protein
MIAGSGSAAAKSIRRDSGFSGITPQAPATKSTGAAPRRSVITFTTKDYPTRDVEEKGEADAGRKTPDLITPAQAKRLGTSAGAPADDSGRDLVTAVSDCIDQALMVMQNRMGTIEAAIKKDPVAFEKPSTEYDMLNAIYRTLQNVSYHLFKIERHVVGKKAVKCAKPIDGESGEAIMISMRSAMMGAQEASTRVVKVVREKVRELDRERYNESMKAIDAKAVAATSKDVIGKKAFEILAKIELAVGIVAASQAKLIDAITKAAAARAKRLAQKAAGAFCQAGGTRKAILQLGMAAWKDGVEACKEERKEEALRKKEAAEGGDDTPSDDDRAKAAVDRAQGVLERAAASPFLQILANAGSSDKFL